MAITPTYIPWKFIRWSEGPEFQLQKELALLVLTYGEH